MDVDVIIPCRNVELFVEDALNGVYHQSHRPQKLIVVDNDSEDLTLSVVERWSFLHSDLPMVILSEARLGVGAARNAGLAVSTASLVAFHDADDLWQPQKLQLQVKLFESRKSADRLGVVYCGATILGENLEPIERPRAPEPSRRGDLKKALRHGNCVVGSASAAVVLREALDDVGYFDCSLPHGEDLDLWRRLAEKWSFDYVNQPLVTIRWRSSGMQQDRRAVVAGEVQLFDLWLSRKSVSLRNWWAIVNQARGLDIGQITDSIQLKSRISKVLFSKSAIFLLFVIPSFLRLNYRRLITLRDRLGMATRIRLERVAKWWHRYRGG